MTWIKIAIFCKILPKNANMFDENFLKHSGLSGAKACKSCRSRQALSNEYLLAKFGVDTEENEPSKVCSLPPGKIDQNPDWMSCNVSSPRPTLGETTAHPPVCAPVTHRDGSIFNAACSGRGSDVRRFTSKQLAPTLRRYYPGRKQKFPIQTDGGTPYTSNATRKSAFGSMSESWKISAASSPVVIQISFSNRSIPSVKSAGVKRRVLRHLMENAISASPQSSPHGKCDISHSAFISSWKALKYNSSTWLKLLNAVRICECNVPPNLEGRVEVLRGQQHHPLGGFSSPTPWPRGNRKFHQNDESENQGIVQNESKNQGRPQAKSEWLVVLPESYSWDVEVPH